MPEDRRDFLKAGLVAAAGVGLIGIPLAAAGETSQKVPLAKPVTVKIVENTETKDGDRTETRAKFDLVGANGSVHRTTGYILKVEREDSYDTTVVLKTDKFFTANDATPADSELQVVIVSADKGAVEGDHRTDEIQATVIGPNGIYKSAPQTIKRPLTDPYAGMSLDAKAQAIIDDRMKNPRQ